MMIETILEIAAVALILWGIVHEEKLAALEDKALDKLAEAIARVIVKRRRRKQAKQAAAYQHR